MSERATAHTITMQPATAREPGTDMAVRPKVLRRPSHFGVQSTIAAPMPTFVPVLTHPATEANAEPVSRAWQDDGRFAAALLAIIIVVNLILSTWLSAISPTPPAPVTIKQNASDTPVIAAPSTADSVLPERPSTAISEQ